MISLIPVFAVKGFITFYQKKKIVPNNVQWIIWINGDTARLFQHLDLDGNFSVT